MSCILYKILMSRYCLWLNMRSHDKWKMPMYCRIINSTLKTLSTWTKLPYRSTCRWTFQLNKIQGQVLKHSTVKWGHYKWVFTYCTGMAHCQYEHDETDSLSNELMSWGMISSHLLWNTTTGFIHVSASTSHAQTWQRKIIFPEVEQIGLPAIKV